MTIYDDDSFFNAYAHMDRSQGGLGAAGEWWQFKKLMPDFGGKRVLDLGCGYGWHCRYAADKGAESVLGIDPSARMLERAREINGGGNIQYMLSDVESFQYTPESFDIVISNLALHYVEDLDSVFENVYTSLTLGGIFLMNIEHPTFTSGVNEDWTYSSDGRPLYWPIDNYFYPGERQTVFLGHQVKKYHHTLTQILMGLINAGFVLTAVEEAMPSPDMLDIPGMRDEMRRPMMLLVRAEKS